MARHDAGPLGRFYHRKKAQVGHKKAVIALARKLLIIAWRMLLSGEPYRAIKPLAVRRKYRTLERLAAHAAPFDAIVLPTIPQIYHIFCRLRHDRTTVPA